MSHPRGTVLKITVGGAGAVHPRLKPVCPIVCGAGSEYVSGVRGLPLTYGTVGEGWLLGWRSRNLPLLRATLEQFLVDTLVAHSLGIYCRVWRRADPRSCLLLQLHRSLT